MQFQVELLHSFRKFRPKLIGIRFALEFSDDVYNPISGSMPSGADTISAKRIDSNTYEATLKKAAR
jgi:hypothetical protein